GAAGELCLAGAGLARGYWGRPDLTAERFVPDGVGGVVCPGSRIYRTGDLARSLPDGRLALLGRIDRQVKVRGFRVELEEVERALDRHPGLVMSAVAAVLDPTGERALVAYVVFAGEPIETGALRRFLGESLPNPMVPTIFVSLPELPLTPNGKVDRRALPLPAPSAAGERAGKGPRTPAEELMTGIWCEVLNRKSVGVEESFFDLGGHSLLAAQVASRVRAVFGVELPVSQLFEHPTLGGLAAAVAERAAGAAGREMPPPIVPVSRQDRLPLSFAQRRLWLVEQLEPVGAAYNMPLLARLSGRLSVAAFARTLAEIVRRHEVLRTSFTAGADGEPWQRIAAPAPLALPVVDLSALGATPEIAERQAGSLAAREAGRPFDLTRSPLLRGALLRLAAEEHLLLLSIHHIAFDGWSLGVLVREMGSLYDAFVRGAASPLPELPIQYADFASWQRSRVDGAALASDLAFWRRHLAGAPEVLALPADHPQPAVPAVVSYRGGYQSFAVPAALSAALRDLCRAEGVTLFMLFFAALNTLFYRSTGQEDVVLGAPIANRNPVETEGLIGFFVNVLPLRTRLSGELSFRRLLARVRAEVLAAAAHQDLPIERLMEELRPDRHLGRTPLYQVVFTMQNAPLAIRDLTGLTLTPLAVDSGTAKFDLTVNAWETPVGIAVSIEHSTDRFEAATVERLWERLLRLLENVVADPETHLDRLEIFTEQERLLFAQAVEVAELEAEFLF
ncbi:MAG TPA: condensation domain-containing protein, partial [Thermoanaerobaculia bacterium]|nr:condensation domain-containing protein [Thermoanaerobaculia bacterium]